MIKSLGYSADAYLEALRLLDERYGGDDRRYITITKEVEQFRLVREENLRDLEEYLNLLNVLLVEFKDNKRKVNLEDGFLYQKLLTKLLEVMLMKWNRKMCKDDAG